MTSAIIARRIPERDAIRASLRRQGPRSLSARREWTHRVSVDQFVPRILESLDEGNIIRRVVAGALRVVAFACVLAGVAAIVAILRSTVGDGKGAQTGLSGVVLAALVLGAMLV